MLLDLALEAHGVRGFLEFQLGAIAVRVRGFLSKN